MHRTEQPPVDSNDFLSEFVIGMSDGLIVPFALTTGLVQVSDSSLMIATVGTIALSTGALVMGMGGYLTGRSESMLYKTPSSYLEAEATVAMADEKEEVKKFLANLDIDENLQKHAAEELAREKKDWAVLMAEKRPVQQLLYRPVKTGLNIGLSYALGGVIPVLPYFFMETTYAALRVSIILTFLTLPILGYLKSRVTGFSPVVGIIRTIVTGLLAGAGAFLVARLFTI